MSEPYWIPVGGAPIVPVATALPASPVDGQECILVDSLTAPTYQWRFRYVASIADAYKWVFIGGSSIYVRVDTDEATTAQSTWVDLATVGPRVLVPRAGNYEFDASCNIWGSANNTWCAIDIVRAPQNGAVDGGSAVAAVANQTAANPVISRQLNALPAGDDVRIRYWLQTAGATGHFRGRWLRCRPVRVA